MKLRYLLFISALSLLSCASPQTSAIVESSSIDVTLERGSSSLVSSQSSEAWVTYDRNPLDEPLIGNQYYLNHIGDIYSCWKQYRGDGVTIAVIDVGFDPYHEDFYYADGTHKVSNQSAAFEYNPSSSQADRTSGVITRVGIDAVTIGGESHGTFCAGVAAAAVNGKGVAGIAPNASLLLLKTDCMPRSVREAFYYASNHGAKVITISIGSYYDFNGDIQNDNVSNLSTVFNDAIEQCYNRGIVVCSAAGNGGGSRPTEYTYPGAVNHVIGVGGLAANSSGEIWEGSSYNSSQQYQFCDVFAPADEMYGCCNHNGLIYQGGWKGTSFASPQVAGLAALYFQKNPSKTAADFETALFQSCHKIETSSIASASQLGYGRIDAGRLLGIACGAKSVNVRVQSTFDTLYCYAWNLKEERENAAWPGVAMSKVNGIYQCNVPTGTYESLVITKGKDGPQSVDLLVPSFQDGHTYVLPSSSDLPYLVGSYSK